MSIFKLYVLILILNLCLTGKKDIKKKETHSKNETHSKKETLQKKEIPTKKETPTKKVEKPKEKEFVIEKTKLLQTLYSDSFSNNFYYTTLYISDRKIKQTYMVDTSSSIMSSPCAPCEYCGKHKTNYYDFVKKKLSNPLLCGSKVCKMLPANGCLGKDKNIQKKTCSFYRQNQNTDGLRGYYLSNIVYFEQDRNLTSSQQKKLYRSYAIPLGCTSGEYGKYKDIKADGIMGLNNDQGSFPTLLYNLKIIKRNLFSLCLGLEGGYMSLGEIDSVYHASKTIQYLPLLNSSYYFINVNGIQIGNNKRTKYNLVANINSKTPFTHLPKNLYQTILDEFNKACTNKKGHNKCGKFQTTPNYGYCADFEDRETLFKTVNENWPNITLELHKNIEYKWKPINYYYYYFNKNQRKACLGFNIHKFSNIILGSNFMHGHDIIFDKEHHSLGFVEADCSRRNIMWNNMKGIISAPATKDKKDPVLEDKEIHKNEKENNFKLGDNNSKEAVEFIKGKNKELQISSDKNLNKLVMILIFILVVVIVLLVVIIILICNKMEYVKYEKKGGSFSDEINTVYIPHNSNEEPNTLNLQEEDKDNKSEENKSAEINQEINFLKSIMNKK